LRRLRVELTGAVQGVGYRPHLYRLATEAGLAGWVENGTAGVRLEVEGPADRLENFLERVRADHPPAASVTEVRHRWVEFAGDERFEIRESDEEGELDTVVSPDLATCSSCFEEILDRGDRRYGYAFTNCTDCGPRFSIIRDLPWDRPFTTMAGFRMCEDCRREYEDPTDRRFHAQPNACPVCGPQLSWADASGASLRGDPIEMAAEALAEGGIVAARGLGGFHLLCDAGSSQAVTELRRRKGRPTKPFAVMVPDLETASRLCRVSGVEAGLLTSAAAPIVLLRRRGDAEEHDRIAQGVAPGNPTLGLMLPYTPLHHLLLRSVGRPLVATSGNRSEEPICTGSAEAVSRLRGIADYFLLHDRPIERPVDDSVVAVHRDTRVPVRRSRGYAPFPLPLSFDAPPILATGGHMKVALALARGRSAWLGPHIGDLDAPESREAFLGSVRDMLRLYRLQPEVVAHDLHPDWATSRWATGTGPESEFGSPRRIAVQHHHAHLAALLTEHGRGPECTPVLGVTWDGTGYGPDGTVWGGEFLLGNAAGYRRVGHLRPFRLAGGEAAIRDPGRIGLELARQVRVEPPTHLGSRPDAEILLGVLRRGTSCVTTTSAGRLFDGVAAMLGLIRTTSFEGEAAMALEFAADPGETRAYPITTGRTPDGAIEVDWRPAVVEAIEELRAGVPVSSIAARFHGAMIEGMVAVAEAVEAAEVGLTGGCFQNRILAIRGSARLQEAGSGTLSHRLVPPNDGGLALGQIAVATSLVES
jgi:hydrogenase maturation protein HypF